MDVCVEQTGRELQSLYLTLHASCAEHAIRSKQARMLTYARLGMLQRLYLTLHVSCAEHAIPSKQASYYYCVLILLAYCYICVHMLLYVSSSCAEHAIRAKRAHTDASYYYICVLILVHILWPHTIYVCPHNAVCVLILSY
jgi:hypothetical protein